MTLEFMKKNCMRNANKKDFKCQILHTLRGGKWLGSEGFAISHIQISPSSAPDARRFGVNPLNSNPRTCT